MGKYRICVFDAQNQARDRFNYTCDTDEDACAEARSMLARFSRAEVWAGSARISSLSMETTLENELAPAVFH